MAKDLVPAETLSPAFADLNERQRAFVYARFDPNTARNLAACARAAGYGEEGTTAETMARIANRLKRNPKIVAAMHELQKELVRDMGPDAVKALQEIIVDPFHKDRLKAVNIVFDRTDPVSQHHTVDVNVKLNPEKDTAEAIRFLFERIAIAEGDFEFCATTEAFEALSHVAAALDIRNHVKLPQLARSRAAATLITAAEAGNLHLPQLQRRAADYDPMTRDRFVAGALTPSSWYIQAQRFRRWFARQVLEVFRTIDVIIAPATPYTAPLIGQETVRVEGADVPARRHLGIFTQPLSLIGLPVIVVPVKRQADRLPIGVQIVAAPWHEAFAFRVAAAAEAEGVVTAPIARSFL